MPDGRRLTNGRAPSRRFLCSRFAGRHRCRWRRWRVSGSVVSAVLVGSAEVLFGARFELALAVLLARMLTILAIAVTVATPAAASTPSAAAVGIAIFPTFAGLAGVLRLIKSLASSLAALLALFGRLGCKLTRLALFATIVVIAPTASAASTATSPPATRAAFALALFAAELLRSFCRVVASRLVCVGGFAFGTRSVLFGLGFGIWLLHIGGIRLVDERRQGFRVRGRNRPRRVGRMNHLATIDHEGLRTDHFGICIDRDVDLEAFFEKPQMAAFLVENIKGDLGSRPHNQIMRRALKEGFLNGTQ